MLLRDKLYPLLKSPLVLSTLVVAVAPFVSMVLEPYEGTSVLLLAAALGLQLAAVMAPWILLGGYHLLILVVLETIVVLIFFLLGLLLTRLLARWPLRWQAAALALLAAVYVSGLLIPFMTPLPMFF